jgi:hypothetical protein
MLKRALLWAVVGSLTAVVIWSALAAILWQFELPHVSVRDIATETAFGFASSMVWALMAAAVAAPAYVIVFALWQLLRGRLSRRNDTNYTRALLCFALALPPIAALVWGFGHTASLPFDWRRVEQIAPLALLSCWGGVWIPQRYLQQLKGVL